MAAYQHGATDVFDHHLLLAERGPASHAISGRDRAYSAIRGIENARRSFRDHCGEALSNFTREGSDKRELITDGGTSCQSHLFPLPFWSKGI
jgi:hypothetical protein